MQRQPRSAIWQLNMFERLDQGYKAQCRICGKFLKMSRRSLRGLITHLNLHLEYKKLYEQLAQQKQRGNGGGANSRKTSTSTSSRNESHESQLDHEINAYINEEMLAERDGLAKYASELYQILREMLMYTYCPNLPKMPNSPKLHSLLMEAQNSGNSTVDFHRDNRALNAGFDFDMSTTMETDDFDCMDQWFRALGIKERP